MVTSLVLDLRSLFVVWFPVVVVSSVPGVVFFSQFFGFGTTLVHVSLHLGLRLVVAPSGFDMVFGFISFSEG